MNVLEQTGNGRVSAEPHANRVRVTFNRGLYPLDAIYGAAYVFIDRCYVYLDAPDEAHVEVVLQSRSSLEAEELNDLAGSFANELLTHAWRAEITEANRPILEAVAAQAMAGAMGTPELEDMDDLDEMDFSEETFEDPLGIAMSWEEKYGEGSGEEKSEAETHEPKNAAEG